MRLALVCTTVLSHPHGGIPSVNRQILRQLERAAAEKGVSLDIDVWVLHDLPGDRAEVRRAIGLRSEDHTFRVFAGSRGAMLVAAAATLKRYDMVFATHLGLSPVARLLRAPRERRYHFLHGVECWRDLPLRTHAGLVGVARFLSNSAFTHRRFLEYNPSYGVIPNQVCWLGAPQEHVAYEAAPEGDGGELSVLIVGRIVGEERYKGHEQLISIWPEVRRQFPTARLDIVGDGNAGPALRAEAERLGLLQEGAVRFWGQLPDADLRERYRRCAIFAMPSRGEGFGLVYLEAMAFGKPCLASLDDAASEVVKDGETGLLVPYSDRERMRLALSRLLESSELRARMGQAGRERVLTCFTETHFGDRLWKALELDRAVPR